MEQLQEHPGALEKAVPFIPSFRQTVLQVQPSLSSSGTLTLSDKPSHYCHLHVENVTELVNTESLVIIIDRLHRSQRGFFEFAVLQSRD